MISPISMNSPGVSFRASDLSAPGKFSSAAAEAGDDKFELSAEAVADKPKKGGVLKTIGKIVGGAAVLLGASFGLFKAKGDKWLAGEAQGVMAGLKKWLVKPGEFVNNKMVNPIIEKFSSKGKSPLEGLADEIASELN